MVPNPSNGPSLAGFASLCGSLSSNVRALNIKHLITKGLEGKGLVWISDWGDTLISLTESGRVRALEIQRQAMRASAAQPLT